MKFHKLVYAYMQLFKTLEWRVFKVFSNIIELFYGLLFEMSLT